MFERFGFQGAIRQTRAIIKIKKRSDQLKRSTIISALTGSASLVLLAGLIFGSRPSGKAVVEAQGSAPNRAIAVLHPTDGNKVHGWVTFTKEGDKVKVIAQIEGLTPGKHGFHIHEFGDCSSKDGAAAGGHFNPAGKSHGAPTDANRHEGDLGNIEAGQDGKARIDLTDSVLKLDGAGSIIGRGVIVHAKADDLKTQPTGDAGGRQACGVIGTAKP
jgi:Cu-Zn family superoxide dismutase